MKLIKSIAPKINWKPNVDKLTGINKRTTGLPRVMPKRRKILRD